MERDIFREELKFLNSLKHKDDLTNVVVIAQFKEKTKRLEERIKQYQAENEKLAQGMFAAEKEKKIVIEDREKLKKNVSKLIARKGKFDQGLKQCKNCSKEFNEKENFNWSCRMHQSEWGGEMWWCCGKRGKEQPGCKFSKHEVANDNEDEDYKSKEDQEQEKLR